MQRTPVLGRKVKALNGQMMTCVTYRSKRDIDILFEDGTLVEHKDASAFTRGQIKNPNFGDARLAYSQKHIGEASTSIAGQRMIIVAWYGTKDVEIQFEDGTVVRGAYTEFKRGSILNPNFTYRDRNLDAARKQWVGQTKKMSNNLSLTLTEYNGNDDCTGVYEDGTQVTFRLNSWKKGYVSHPNIENVRLYLNQKQRIGSTINTAYGLSAKIVAYRSNEDIDVEFEDGIVVRTKLRSFKDKNCKVHPIMKLGARSYFNYNNMICRSVFSNGQDRFYACKCPKCGFDQILSAKEMIQPHICEDD